MRRDKLTHFHLDGTYPSKPRTCGCGEVVELSAWVAVELYRNGKERCKAAGHCVTCDKTRILEVVR